VHPTLRVVADRQFGAFASEDAIRAGYTPEEVRSEVSRGRWIRLRRGVYAQRAVLAAVDADPVGRHRLECAAVLVRLRGRPVVSHASPARLSGIVVPSSGTDVVRLTDEVQWRRGRGYEVARATLLPSEVHALGAFRITASARTLVDCAREWPLEDAVVAMDAALNAGLSSHADLTDAVLAQRHWAGIGDAARAANLADARAESPLETLGRLRILASGLPAPELQVEIRDARASSHGWTPGTRRRPSRWSSTGWSSTRRLGTAVRRRGCSGRRSAARTGCGTSTSGCCGSSGPIWGSHGSG
jgi:predicted transcriptional regulator of viral defense system